MWSILLIKLTSLGNEFTLCFRYWCVDMSIHNNSLDHGMETLVIKSSVRVAYLKDHKPLLALISFLLLETHFFFLFSYSNSSYTNTLISMKQTSISSIQCCVWQHSCKGYTSNMHKLHALLDPIVCWYFWKKKLSHNPLFIFSYSW